ncbi:MAG TPA: hypothetical protein VM616_02920 [Gammaproteobacteria bacterium]|nr:hypothetical protein [Gammaproteobacteria bacterium]
MKSALRASMVPALLTLAGCAGWPSPAGRADGIDPAGVGVYLTELRRLKEADPATQAEIYAQVREAFEDVPTTTHRLTLALMLGQPGHPWSDDQAAQQMLSELLAAPESLLPDEHALAVIQRLDIEQRLRLEAENQRLAALAAEAASRQDTDTERRLRDALAENRRLRAALEEAQAKLEAVTSIERSIRERDGEGGTTP